MQSAGRNRDDPPGAYRPGADADVDEAVKRFPLLDSFLEQKPDEFTGFLAGKYLYSGSRTDVPPFNAPDLATLSVVASPIASFFDNSQQKAEVRIDTNQVVQYGVLADDMGQAFMASVKRLGEYDAATPFSANLTSADRAMLQTEIANLDAVMSGVIKLQANNGFIQKRIEPVVSRHETLVTVNKQLISDVSEVDMAAAITKFNQDKLAFESSYNLLRQVSQINLLRYL